MAINDDAIFSEDNALEAFAALRTAKASKFTLTVGYLDKTTATDLQRERDDRLDSLLTEESSNSDSDDDPIPSSSTAVAPSVVAPSATPGHRRSARLSTRLNIHGLLVRADHIHDVDP